MNFALHVTCAPYSKQGNLSALNFARALIEKDHRLTRVFFSSDGVHTGSQLVVCPQDEIDIPACWSELASTNNIELILCISACLKRGLLDEGEAERYEKGSANIRAPFIISGLGQLAEAAITNDRLVTFGV
ncbi:MAG: sulfurtransferase complex subunit TusD [Moraxellaceae bacterium]|nr:MAG: sulfurtransferase complex subunit TusD [Moraxellaceae bacterium]